MSRVVLFSSFYAMMSSVIYYSTHTAKRNLFVKSTPAHFLTCMNFLKQNWWKHFVGYLQNPNKLICGHTPENVATALWLEIAKALSFVNVKF